MYETMLMVQYAGIAILVAEIVFLFFQNPSKIQRDMFLLLVALLITFVAYTMELKATDMQGKLQMAILTYLGKPMIVFSMLMLILDYCRITLSKYVTAGIFFVQAFFSVTAFTTREHHMFYTSVEMVNEGAFDHLKTGKGIFYILYTVVLVLYCIVMIGICVAQLKTVKSEKERKQIRLFGVMVFVPMACLFVYFTGVFKGYDCTLAGYLFATICFCFSFFRLDMFDTVTLAKEQAVDYINCGMLVYDNKERLVYHNEMADKLDIYHEAVMVAASEEPFQKGDRIYSIEDRVIEKEGIRYGHMYFIQDMTEHYYYAEQLKLEKLRADEASRAKTDFLSSMSHDIRTPMNAILGMTKIAGVHLDEPEKVSDCLRKIDMSGQHLLELINEVLDMNKIESGKLELNNAPFDMGQLFEEIFIMAKPLAEAKGHEFIADVDSIVHKAVTGDKSRLSQVLMNFISNSMKYTNDGGKVWFTAAESEVSEQEVVYTFTVRDNGIGMSREYLPHLFDPFTRAKDDNVEKAQGTGLGMAITKNFVDLMGGELHVESELGEGSTFTVKVTLRLQTKEESEELANVVDMTDFQKMDLSGKRVLLAEDNELNAIIAGEILGMTELTVEYAVNGKEALEKVAACESGYYDFVLMDIQMPVMDGYEATTQIRQLDKEYTSKLPIIAMTADAFAEDVQKARDMGMDGHIAKPLDLGQLMGMLRKVLGDRPRQRV